MSKINDGYIETMLSEGKFFAVFPKIATEKNAVELLDMLDSAIGIAQFDNDEDPTEPKYGVLIEVEKSENQKKHLKLNPLRRLFKK